MKKYGAVPSRYLGLIDDTDLNMYAGLTVASMSSFTDLPLPGRSQTVAPDFTFALLTTPQQEPAGGDWMHHWQAKTNTPGLSLARASGNFLLRFPDLADFLISADGCQIGAWPAPATNAETLRHLLLDQVLPRVLAHQGRLVLHAGAVRVGHRAITFLGETGSGKSTLVASLNAAGYSLLSDDGLVLTQNETGTLALPTYPSLRLWPDGVNNLFLEKPALTPMAHYSTKQRVIVEGSTKVAEPLLLAAIYVLAPETGEDTISLTRLSKRDACMAIISNAFQLDVSDHARAASLLVAAAGVAQQVPAFTLAFPRDFTRLPEVQAAILQQHEQWAGGVPANTTKE